MANRDSVRAARAGESLVEVRWAPRESGVCYLVEWSSDGRAFYGLASIEGDEIADATGPDGHMTYADTTPDRNRHPWYRIQVELGEIGSGRWEAYESCRPA